MLNRISLILTLFLLVFPFQLRQSQSYCTDTGCPQECMSYFLNFFFFQEKKKYQCVILKSCCTNLCHWWRRRIVSRFSVPGPSGQAGGGDDLTLPMVLMGWVALALLLFLLRPSGLRGPRHTDKTLGSHNVSKHHPPKNIWHIKKVFAEMVLSLLCALDFIWLCIVKTHTLRCVATTNIKLIWPQLL